MYKHYLFLKAAENNSKGISLLILILSHPKCIQNGEKDNFMISTLSHHR